MYEKRKTFIRQFFHEFPFFSFISIIIKYNSHFSYMEKIIIGYVISTVRHYET